MGGAITELVPLALVVAIRPIAILAVIVMLLTDRERANPLAYLAGWALAVFVLAGVAAIFGLDSVRTTPSQSVAVVLVVLSVLMFSLAANEWRLRPRRGEPHKIEPWMRVLHTITPPRAFLLGIFLAAFNVKDLLTTVQAGTVIASDSLTLVSALVSLVIFVLISSSTIIIPITVAAAFGQRVYPLLHRWRHWLERHGRLVAAALFVLIGLVLLTRGLSVLI